LFIEYVRMSRGECLQGWITMEVPGGYKIERHIWGPGGETLAEWHF
jgi:hypothetical protein